MVMQVQTPRELGPAGIVLEAVQVKVATRLAVLAIKMSGRALEVQMPEMIKDRRLLPALQLGQVARVDLCVQCPSAVLQLENEREESRSYGVEMQDRGVLGVEIATKQISGEAAIESAMVTVIAGRGEEGEEMKRGTRTALDAGQERISRCTKYRPIKMLHKGAPPDNEKTCAYKMLVPCAS